MLIKIGTILSTTLEDSFFFFFSKTLRSSLSPHAYLVCCVLHGSPWNNTSKRPLCPSAGAKRENMFPKLPRYHIQNPYSRPRQHDHIYDSPSLHTCSLSTHKVSHSSPPPSLLQIDRIYVRAPVRLLSIQNPGCMDHSHTRGRNIRYSVCLLLKACDCI